MALYRAPAIILRTYPFQETHFIVTLLSPIFGKSRVIAKGCRRLQSSLGRAVQPMVYGIFQFAEGKNLDVITQGVVKEVFPKIREDFDRLMHALYALELVDRLIEESEPQAPLFLYLLKTLEALNNGEPTLSLLRLFEARMLKILGYAPELKCCVVCENSKDLSLFSIRLGGLLCSVCKEKDKQGVIVDSETISALRQLFEAVSSDLPFLSDAMSEKIARMIQRFIEEKTGRIMHGFNLISTNEKRGTKKVGQSPELNMAGTVSIFDRSGRKT